MRAGGAVARLYPEAQGRTDGARVGGGEVVVVEGQSDIRSVDQIFEVELEFGAVAELSESRRIDPREGRQDDRIADRGEAVGLVVDASPAPRRSVRL